MKPAPRKLEVGLQQRLKDEIAHRLPSLVSLRQQLHQYPELCFEERETQAILLKEIAKIPDWQVQCGIAETGIVATLNAKSAGPCIALRADMDGLPITENTGKPYSSRNPGKMHACGHDGHMTCLVGAMQVLASMRSELSGPIRAVFQPAEEGGGGALRMCEEGILENPSVQAIFGFHGWPSERLGTLTITPGRAWAAFIHLEIKVIGKGGHAAMPHRCIDPVIVAAQIVTALQTVTSRSVDPIEATVLSVTRIEAGTTDNVIPDYAILEGTIRYFTPDAAARIRDRVNSIATHIAQAFGASVEILLESGYPTLVNDPKLTSRSVEYLASLSSWTAVSDSQPPVMVAEDFSYYSERVPGAFFFLGLRPHTEESMPGLHTPRFDFPDTAIPFGVELLCSLALNAPALLA